MATPRRPYTRLPLGIIDDALRDGMSSNAALLLALIYTHPGKRNIPGLLTYGPSGLAESVNGFSPAAVKRGLAELAKSGRIATDFSVRPALIYVRGAVEADPPAVENSVRGMAKQLRELPTSRVTDEVRLAIESVIPTTGWRTIWREIIGKRQDDCPSPGPSPSPEPDPFLRSQDPRSQDPTTTTQDVPPEAAAVEAFLSMFGTRYRELRGIDYPDRLEDRSKAQQLVQRFSLDQLTAMTIALMQVSADDQDTWLASTDRSVSVLAHRAEQLLGRVPSAAGPPPIFAEIFREARGSIGADNAIVKNTPGQIEGKSYVLYPVDERNEAMLRPHVPALRAAIEKLAPGMDLRIEPAAVEHRRTA